MCIGCHESQKQQESSQLDFDYSYQPPRYGTGNSKFYTQSDVKSHNSVKRLPSVKKLNELDQTLYLSKSTFFNDTKPHATTIIPLSPTACSGKTTIIPITVEGRNDVKDHSLVQFERNKASLIDEQTDSQGNVNGFNRCVISLPSTSSNYKPNEFKPVVKTLNSEQVDGKHIDLPIKCRSIGCSFFGTTVNVYCSKCSQDQKIQTRQYQKMSTEI
jgi:OTU domain-containing protein 7